MSLKDETNLAWLAGFFEGEGTIGVRRDQKGYIQGQLSLCQATLEPLEFACEVLKAYGVEIASVCRQRNGLYRLYAASEKGSRILHLLQPYLHHPKYQERTKIYLEIFPLGTHSWRMPEVRLAGYTNWLELKIKEIGKYEVTLQDSGFGVEKGD